MTQLPHSADTNIWSLFFCGDPEKKFFIRVTTLTRFRCVVGLGLYRFLVFKILKT